MTKQWNVEELCEAVRSAFGVVTSDRCVYEAEFKETNEQMEAVINALRSIRPPDEPSVKNDHLATALSILRDAAIEKDDALPPELAKALLDEIERLRFAAEPSTEPASVARASENLTDRARMLILIDALEDIASERTDGWIRQRIRDAFHAIGGSEQSGDDP